MLVVGHRGASADAAENTPEAFLLADAQGADAVELDVRLTSAGSLVVRHDPLPISADADAATDAEARAPSLHDVLDACGSRMLVNVEIKNLASDGGFDPTMSIVSKTIAELRRRGAVEQYRWLISSFSWATVTASRQMAPEVATGFLCVSPDDTTIVRVAAAGHRAIHPWHGNVNATFVGRCHDLGVAVNTWTCNEPSRLVELGRHGVDGVCTDVPAVAREALARGAITVADGVTVEERWGTPTSRRPVRE